MTTTELAPTGTNEPKPRYLSTCHLLFVFDGETPTDDQIQEAWDHTRGSGMQSVRLHLPSIRLTTNGRTTVVIAASYGPVRGNWQSDYAKVEAVADRLDALDGQVLRFSFRRWAEPST